jgi:hypothetical protein
MLIGDAIAAPSEIDGVGVFANRALPIGTVVWAPCPGCRRWSAEQAQTLDAALGRHLEEFGYRTADAGVLLPCRSAYLLNHSCEANVLDFGADFGVAVCNIDAGVELTLDYGTFCDDAPWRFACRCGSDRCRMTISSDDGAAAGRRASWAAAVRPARARVELVPQPLDRELAAISGVYRALRGGASKPLDPSVTIRDPAFLRRPGLQRIRGQPVLDGVR